MGQITAFDIGKIVDVYKCTSYVETGTGIGVSLKHALGFNFNKAFTVDIDEQLIESIKKEVTDPRVFFFNNKSTDALKSIVEQIENDESVLFFLDAHFPGADFHKISYEQSMRIYKKDSMPLEEELTIIKTARPNKKDVIIIDDLKLYKEGQYEHSIWEYAHIQEEIGVKRSADFVNELYSNTHEILTYNAHQGYMILVPKV
jgi:hypothetical protein